MLSSCRVGFEWHWHGITRVEGAVELSVTRGLGAELAAGSNRLPHVAGAKIMTALFTGQR
jgi:hypothetical protein